MSKKKPSNTQATNNTNKSQEQEINLDIQYFLILPHQLFEKDCFKKVGVNLKQKKILLWEHPQYFTKYHYNKKD